MAVAVPVMVVGQRYWAPPMLEHCGMDLEHLDRDECQTLADNLGEVAELNHRHMGCLS